MSEITDLLFSQMLPSPERAMADKLRRKKEAEQLAGASEKANSLNMLEFASQLSNNPGLAKAAPMLAKSTREQYGPVQMGQQGFMLPDTGEYTESPMYSDNKEADRQTKLLNMLQLTEAAGQRAQDANALKMTLAQMNDSRARDLMQMRLDAQAARDAAKAAEKTSTVDRDVAKFSAALEKSGIPEVESGIATVQRVLNSFPVGKLPGAGRMVGAVPDAMLSDETQNVRTEMQGLANIILKSRSGAAVTEAEQQRFLREVGSGKGMSETALRTGWAAVFRSLESKRNNIVAGASPETVQEYNRRFGSTYAHAGTPKTQKAAKDMTDAEIEAELKGR